MDGKYDKRPIPGKNLKLGIDINLQMLGERLLKNKIGSIVAIEPETGEILCMVSSPDFDPRLDDWPSARKEPFDAPERSDETFVKPFDYGSISSGIDV